MRLTALLALLAVSAVLAACGGSDSAEDARAPRAAPGRTVRGQRQEGEGRQRDRRRPGPHALPLHGRGPGRPGLHRRLRRDLAAGRGRRRASGLPKHVATVKRPDDGKLQLTYDGHPLYRYAGDRSKADANGEGVGGQWFVVKAGGAGASSSKAAQPAGGKSSYGY